jgi:antitoxin (DNA-binding transcriptional repressor) of toxin-antitoxin stability system
MDPARFGTMAGFSGKMHRGGRVGNMTPAREAIKLSSLMRLGPGWDGVWLAVKPDRLELLHVHRSRRRVMVQITVAEAQRRLPDLLDAVEAGEEVEIRAEDGRSYRIASSRPRPPVTGVPRAGRLKGRLVVPDDIKEPLDEMKEYME